MKSITKEQLKSFAEQSHFAIDDFCGSEEEMAKFDNQITIEEYSIGDNLLALLKLLDIEVTE
jgi:hypothetical protein